MSGGGADGPSWEVGLIALGTSTYSYTAYSFSFFFFFFIFFFISALRSMLVYLITGICFLD